MQFQSDILDVEVERPKITETTALGAAYLAGLASEFWTRDDIDQKWQLDQRFQPEMQASDRNDLYKGWKKAVKRTMGWEDQE